MILTKWVRALFGMPETVDLRYIAHGVVTKGAGTMGRWLEGAEFEAELVVRCERELLSSPEPIQQMPIQVSGKLITIRKGRVDFALLIPIKEMRWQRVVFTELSTDSGQVLWDKPGQTKGEITVTFDPAHTQLNLDIRVLVHHQKVRLAVTSVIASADCTLD